MTDVRRRDDSAHLISRTRRAIHDFLVAALRAHDMGAFAPSHGDIIAALLYHDAMTMTELAARINRDRSTVTTLVQKLSDEGYIAFRDHPEDARSHLVYLTAQGQALRPTFEAISAELAATMWRGIDDATRDCVRAALQRMVRNFDEAAAEG